MLFEHQAHHWAIVSMPRGRNCALPSMLACNELASLRKLIERDLADLASLRMLTLRHSSCDLSSLGIVPQHC